MVRKQEERKHKKPQSVSDISLYWKLNAVKYLILDISCVKSETINQIKQQIDAS